MKSKDSKNLLLTSFRRDIYEDEIIALNEELEHIRLMGGRIIEERTAHFKLENAMLRQALSKAGI